MRRRLVSALIGVLLLGPTLVAPPLPAAATSTAGTDFWVAFPKNVGTENLELFITGSTSTTGTVSGTPIGSPINFTVTAGQVTTVSLPLDALVLTAGVSAKGVRITAALPVTVYGINQRTATTDGFLAIPVDALGSRYRIAAPTGGQYAVVGTEADTVVSVDGTVVGTVGAGDVYFADPSGDPSGTLITATAPVAVFAGHGCSSFPGGGACDHQTEQLPPTDSWGSDFVVMRYANRIDAADVFLIVADRDGTEVTVDGASVVTLPAGGVHQLTRYGLNGSSLINGGRITTSEPVLVVQFMRYGSYGTEGVSGDPAMSVIPPFEQFQTGYTLATMASGFAFNAVNVVMPTSAIAGFRLDGAAVADRTFEPLGASGFSGAQIEIAPGTYTLSASQPFGVFLYGANGFDSYAVPGGMSLSPVALITSLTLASTVTAGTLDGDPSVCFSATVRDGSANPLEGIRVDFALSGALTDAGAATTAADGVATLCVTNTSSTGGSVAVTATVATLTDSGSRTIPAAGQPVSGGSQPDAPTPEPVADPGGGLPVTPPGTVTGSVGGVPTTPTPARPNSGTAEFRVGTVEARVDVAVAGAGTVGGTGSAPVIRTVRDRVAQLTGGGMQPGGIAEVWLPLPDGGSRQVALLPIGADGTFDGALPFTGELDGRGPLPIGDRTIQLFGIGADGRLTVVNFGVRIEQPGPLAPEPERAPGAPPTLSPGQSLATNAGVPTPVTVTPLPDASSTRIEGSGWLMEVDIPEGSVRDEGGAPLIEIVNGEDSVVRGTGFMPGTRAYVWLMSTPTFLGEVTVGADGTFSGTVPVDGVAVGQHTLQLSGVGTDGFVRAANLGVVVTGDGLPVPTRVPAGDGPIGGGMLPVMLVALALAGLGAVARGRRARRGSAGV